MEDSHFEPNLVLFEHWIEAAPTPELRALAKAAFLRERCHQIVHHRKCDKEQYSRTGEREHPAPSQQPPVKERISILAGDAPPRTRKRNKTGL